MCDLLARIFVADPLQRITISQICQHSWFLKNLPSDLADPEYYARRQQPTQTVEQIRALIETARFRISPTPVQQQQQPMAESMEYQSNGPGSAGGSLNQRYVNEGNVYFTLVSPSLAPSPLQQRFWIRGLFVTFSLLDVIKHNQHLMFCIKYPQ